MDQIRMQYLRIYTKYMGNEETPCPYCGRGVGYADLHDDDCHMLDIIAYIENGVPLPAPEPATPAADGDQAGEGEGLWSWDVSLQHAMNFDKVVREYVVNASNEIARLTAALSSIEETNTALVSGRRAEKILDELSD